MSVMDLQPHPWQRALEDLLTANSRQTTMKTSTLRRTLTDIRIRRIAFVLATAVCALPLRPAIAQDRDGHDRQVDRKSVV